MPTDGKTRILMLAEREEDLEAELFKDSLDLSKQCGELKLDSPIFSADIISLFVRDEEWGERTVRAIKSQPELFLKPLATLSEIKLDALRDLIDDAILLPVATEALNSRIERLIAISHRVDELSPLSNDLNCEGKKEILLIRYLFTRSGLTIRPVRSLSSPFGYTYPLVQSISNLPPGEEFSLMEGMEENHLIQGTLVDKVHLCPFCRHFQINFRETCPSCQSLGINEERTLHHFRCAYVGREKEFRQGGSLRCPKCGRTIRHIGVDYDRPSTDIWCEECNRNFAEPLVICFCMSCAKSFSPKHALPKVVKEYSLTRGGERVAEKGILPKIDLTEILKKEFGFYTLNVFQEFLRLEIMRCRRNNFDSTLVRVSIRNFHKTIEEGGIVLAEKLKEEISVLFKGMFRESDILTDLDHDEILVILTHTDTKQAKIALDRIRENCRRHFKTQIEVDYHLFSLREQTGEVEQILENIR